MRGALALLCVVAVGCDDDEPPRVGSWECGPPQVIFVELSTRRHEMCVGTEQPLTAVVNWSCGKPVTTDASFSSSDPVVIQIDGNRAIARASGAAELVARAEGVSSQVELVKVVRCPDAGVSSDASAAADADDAD